MITPSAGAIIGLAVGTGLAMAGSWMLARRPRPLAERIGPYLGLPGAASAAIASPPARRRSSLASARVPAMRWVLSGAVGGALLGAVLVATGAKSILPAALAVLGAAFAWAAADLHRRRAAAHRADAIQGQLPMLADLLALGAVAGLAPVDAMDVAARTLRGPIAAEVAHSVSDLRAGIGVEAALRGLAERTGLLAMARFVETVLLAQEMGTPLADVLRAQATDLRVEQRRRLMESAGRKDAAMLVPIVFLVLPSVIVIALYPGMQSLRVVLP